MQLHLIRVLTVTRSTLAQAALLKASQGGKLPIVCDTSPCLSTLKASLTSPDLKCVFCLSTGAVSDSLQQSCLTCAGGSIDFAGNDCMDHGGWHRAVVRGGCTCARTLAPVYLYWLTLNGSFLC